ncbi:AsmA family protein [Hyphobacterium sp. CCMP332]|nr:AsmA family protein [Hyphobacterium sp. CCMP332]
MIRRLLTFIFGLVVILVLAAIIIPFLVPESFYRERAQIAASENLGREVILAGDVSLRLLPSVQVQARNVSIANEEGFGDTPFAEMAEMRVGVQLCRSCPARLSLMNLSWWTRPSVWNNVAVETTGRSARARLTQSRCRHPAASSAAPAPCPLMPRSEIFRSRMVRSAMPAVPTGAKSTGWI